MNQIKKRIGKDPTFTLAQFKADMHQVWINARLYNQEDSWVYNAAEDMQAFFDEKWEEEVPKLASSTAGNGVEGSNGASAAASGTSTPMYKPDKVATLPTRIKINVSSAKSRLAEVSRDPTPSEESEEDDDDDDDY